MTGATDLVREDAAWLAGLLDGEGCFDSPRGLPRIRLGMTDHDVVLRAVDVMGGGSTYLDLREPPRKPMLRASVSGERAVGIMRAVLPWLGSRRSAKVTEIVMTYDARRRTAMNARLGIRNVGIVDAASIRADLAA